MAMPSRARIGYVETSPAIVRWSVTLQGRFPVASAVDDLRHERGTPVSRKQLAAVCQRHALASPQSSVDDRG
jgi:hypothetical protein